jgi:hypothetical protein
LFQFNITNTSAANQTLSVLILYVLIQSTKHQLVACLEPVSTQPGR